MFKKNILNSLAKILGVLTVLTYFVFALAGLVLIYGMSLKGDADLLERITFILSYEVFGFMFFGIIYLVTGTLQKLNKMTCQSIQNIPEETQED